MPSPKLFYHRTPGRVGRERRDFQRLVAELKRLASKKGYSQGQIASEIEVALITINPALSGLAENQE